MRIPLIQRIPNVLRVADVGRVEDRAGLAGRMTIAVRSEDVKDPRCARNVAEEESRPENSGRLSSGRF